MMTATENSSLQYRDTTPMTTTVCVGCVVVNVPCFYLNPETQAWEQDTITFKHIGYALYGSGNAHWRSRRYLNQAKKVASNALKKHH